MVWRAQHGLGSLQCRLLSLQRRLAELQSSRLSVTGRLGFMQCRLLRVQRFLGLRQRTFAVVPVDLECVQWARGDVNLGSQSAQRLRRASQFRLERLQLIRRRHQPARECRQCSRVTTPIPLMRPTFGLVTSTIDLRRRTSWVESPTTRVKSPTTARTRPSLDRALAAFEVGRSTTALGPRSFHRDVI